MTNIRIHIIKGIRYVGNSQTMFAPTMQNGDEDVFFTYGINGSIRKRLDHQTQSTDYYYFNASGNLKACGTDMQISVYGYNSANTRTYKVNLFNANQWVNGQPQPIQPMVQNAMFYPNTYINFTQAGEYTKHYYNGTERIASRLGEQQVPISVENEQELEAYKQDVKQMIYNAIGQHLYDEPTDMQEGEVFHLEYLQPCGNNNAVYYYHPNHLSSTMYVTDVQQSVVQSFLYAPYGEIISEYNTHAMGDAFPKYAFNAKELDEETGMYYYEARYYAPPVFTSRDPMFEKKPWLSPYHYCSNNPVGRVDPSGCEDWIPPTDGSGNWTAERGDGYWELAKKAGIPLEEARAAVITANKKRGQKRTTETMVYPGDVVNIGGSNTETNSETNRPSISGYPLIPASGRIDYSPFNVEDIFGIGIAKEVGFAVAKGIGSAISKVSLKTISTISKGKIAGFTKHGIKRAVERKFSKNSIVEIVDKGKIEIKTGRYGVQTQYHLNGNTVVLNEKKEIITVFSSAENGVFIP